MKLSKCNYCLRDHPSSILVVTEHGDICICCISICFYDGWDRRTIYLTPEEMRIQYPGRMRGEVL